ncbi:ATP synthase subunit a-like [Schistocerca piceifrons]|uniref:ATP synthase subunit a-like n=1 Tax=Schistocerca piceifrons TaxID=274613 RepID=UPI001F5FC92F|nr:ATP synthase subunit a-like [Schistocerca piceifrons]
MVVDKFLILADHMYTNKCICLLSGEDTEVYNIGGLCMLVFCVLLVIFILICLVHVLLATLFCVFFFVWFLPFFIYTSSLHHPFVPLFLASLFIFVSILCTFCTYFLVFVSILVNLNVTIMDGFFHDFLFSFCT